MRALIQRVSKASVNILGNTHSAIKNGLLVFACWENDDDFSDSDWMLHKILNLSTRLESVCLRVCVSMCFCG